MTLFLASDDLKEDINLPAMRVITDQFCGVVGEALEF